MIYESFPDLAWVKKQAESGFLDKKAWNGLPLSQTGWPTVILNVKASAVYRDNIPGPLSFFTTLSGSSKVHVAGSKTNIPADCYYLTNPGQHYTLEIGEKTQAETFNIHFGEKWAEETIAGLTKKAEALLDQPDSLTSLNFYNKLSVKNREINALLAKIKSTKDEGTLNQDETLVQLLVHLLRENYLVNESASNIPALKVSTREEVIRRLLLATDYIYANYSKSISLDELASISCLSRFHFLRLFKQVFQKTPHQFCTDIRLKRAKELLRTEKKEVKQIALDLGFTSTNTFSRLFYNHVGVYPSQFS